MAHTKGPWEVLENYDNMLKCDFEKEGVFGTIRGANEFNIARIWQLFGEKESESNAQLIAAAPDLLHAAKLALKTLTVGYENGKGIVNAEMALHAFGNLKYAINKAEGGNNNVQISEIRG